ncbi:MAG: hypothetical protein WCJ35_27665 [Planctomycetota bacterium]
MSAHAARHSPQNRPQSVRRPYWPTSRGNGLGPYLLEKLQDPKHDEHDEALEWVGNDFDPEKFDLDEVNHQLLRLRRWLGRRRGKNAPKAFFAKGTLVQVKHGVAHDQYADIPLGGWVGKVKRIGWLIPIAYASYGSHQFDDVEGGCRPTPFRFHLLQLT